jgi:tetratricopeptide (TPR) repeat protein
VATYPGWDHAHHLLGKATLALGLSSADSKVKLAWLEKSAAAFERAELLAPAEATHPFYRGSALYFFPEPSPDAIDQARRCLQRSLDTRPENALAHYYLAVLARRAGQPDDAHLRQALLYQPDFPEAHAQLGIRLEEHGEAFMALTHYARAVRSTAADDLWPCLWLAASSRRCW